LTAHGKLPSLNRERSAGETERQHERGGARESEGGSCKECDHNGVSTHVCVHTRDGSAEDAGGELGDGVDVQVEEEKSVTKVRSSIKNVISMKNCLNMQYKYTVR
jgi:hypothetical protein